MALGRIVKQLCGLCLAKFGLARYIETMRPLHDNVLIARTSAESTTQSGLIIPEAAKSQPNQGRVVAVGPGLVNASGVRLPMTVKAGDVVLFEAGFGTEISVRGERVLVMPESAIIAVVE